MTERLDRIEAAIESTRSDINTLLGAASTNEVACRDLRETATENAAACRELRISITENQDRFVVLREEARADRAETRRLFNDAITQVEIDRVEYRRRCDELQRQADEDRRRADDERRRADERHTAQMEVIQTLLLELTKSNGNIGKLRDRVDGLEQAS